MVGEYHLGEFVNRFRVGSLVMRLPDSEAAPIPTQLFGTINGVIGLVASLPADQFAFLTKLQVSFFSCPSLLPPHFGFQLPLSHLEPACPTRCSYIRHSSPQTSSPNRRCMRRLPCSARVWSGSVGIAEIQSCHHHSSPQECCQSSCAF